MSDIIQLLPDAVANQIAAGEVIQRPASVIKELVENSIDAGATRIDVLVVDAGRTSIQVIDDGKGMSETDARLSFERHATSKIRKADDLFALHTMGFRGEALASIAAVAQVELKTRPESEEVGTHLSLAGCKITGQEPCSCPVGSNFLVSNLFFNVPARRKFLKSNSTELNNIVAAFERIVLVYPDIHFTLHSNGYELLNLPRCGMRQRIVDVFGKKINQDLLPVKVETSVCAISGFIGKPQSARKKMPNQYFFVNGRFMKHPYFSKAVTMAYERLVPQGEQVPYFLFFDVKTEDIDVNIHPTKTEIKFENEQAIWQILAAAVKESLGVYNDVPTIDFDVQGKPDIPVYSPDDNISAPKVSYNPNYNPFASTGTDVETPSAGKSSGMTFESRLNTVSKVPDQWEQLYQGLGQSTPEPSADLFAGATDSVPQPHDMHEVIEDKAPSHYQYKGTYIMTAVKSGLMIIDQHRAHVRILYELYLDRLSSRKSSTQQLLFPESVQLSPSQRIVYEKVAEEMRAMGFDLQDLGAGNLAINGIPAGLDGIAPSTLILDMIDTAAENTVSIKTDIDSSLALSMARAAAIPQGQVLANVEMESIVNSLFLCQNPNVTPDGKHIIGILKQTEIEHLLG